MSAPSDDRRAANRARFELELEFVQALANPFYLHSLAQQNVLAQPAVVHFLRYLLYWKDKEYARFILSVPRSAPWPLLTLSPRASYPHALHHLDLLQHAAFRQEVAKDEWREYLNQKQFDHWRTWYDGDRTSSHLPLPVPTRLNHVPYCRRDDPARLKTRIAGQPPPAHAHDPEHAP